MSRSPSFSNQSLVRTDTTDVVARLLGVPPIDPRHDHHCATPFSKGRSSSLLWWMKRFQSQRDGTAAALFLRLYRIRFAIEFTRESEAPNRCRQPVAPSCSAQTFKLAKAMTAAPVAALAR